MTTEIVCAHIKPCTCCGIIFTTYEMDQLDGASILLQNKKHRCPSNFKNNPCKMGRSTMENQPYFVIYKSLIL